MKNNKSQAWPELIFDQLKDTITTVQLWTQIIGKIRLTNMPWLNHSWHVTLYVSPRGLTTGSIPYEDGIFQMDMDFIQHELIITASNGKKEKMGLYPRSVANFYNELFLKLQEMNIEVEIHATPNEVDPAIPFQEDELHCSYDPQQMNLLWQALVHIETVFTRFRSGFTGKCSPVHFFWGAFDLAVTRFSGRKAPLHPGGAPNIPNRVMQEAYSHEVSSCGFWPGSEQSPAPVFYAYCYPTPADFQEQPVKPAQAFYSQEMGEFILPYEVVQQATDPAATLLQFLRSTYTAAAKTGNWDKDLECNLTYLEK
ncbi:DUF5996 family protein [Pedobacter sp. L105]|uniref:DUF5996 family protein n=1 Tax=Pedobacter sp. L105 TaxID=1641871 RepID=UPI00131DAB72|nr:DUF5996 family protein [Pedobacter sp. L105]